MGQPLEFEFRAKGDKEVVAAVDRVHGKLDELGGSTASASSAFSGFAVKAGAVGIALTAAAASVNAAVGKVKAFAQEFDRTASILNRFTGNIDKAAERTNGLISRLDLMVASNKAAQAGLNLTSDEFATVAVRANEFAAANGVDAVNAIERLTEGLARGEAGVLKQFGIRVEGITGQANIQREAIRQLQAQWGTATSSADTFGGALGIVSARLDDMKLAFFEGLNASSAVGESFGRLSTEVGELARALGIDLGDGFDLIRQAGIATTAVIATLIDRVTALARAARLITGGDILAGLRELQRASSLEGTLSDFQRNLNRAQTTAADRRAPQAIPSLGAANDNAGKPGRSAAIGSVVKDEDKFAEAKAERVREVEAQIADVQREQNEQQERLNKAKLDEIALVDKLAGRTAKVISLEEKRKELTEQQSKKLEEFGQAGAAAGELIAQAIEGNALGALDAFLKQKARENALLAVENTAKGIAAAIWAPHAAAQFFAAAAMHAGIAAGAGVGAAVVPGGGSGAAPVSAGGANRPVAESSGAATSGGNTYVINVNGGLGTKAEVGREVHLALKEAQRTGDIPRAA